MRRPDRALAPVARPAAWLAVAFMAAAAVLSSAGPAHAAEPFRFPQPNVQVTEGQAIVRLVVERTDLPVSRVTVDYRTEAGSATENVDFMDEAGRLVFDVGQRQATLVVYLRDDDVAEEREHFVVQLLGSSSASATVVILDDDGVVRAPSASSEPAGRTATASEAPAVDTPTAAPAAPRTEVVRRRVVATRSAAPTPRRVTVRQSPVTPFELRPAPGAAALPGAVDPAIALLAGLVLAKVAAEVWFRARTPAS